MLPLVILTAFLAGSSHQATARRAVDNNSLKPLRFHHDGNFRITVFSDFHFGDGKLS